MDKNSICHMPFSFIELQCDGNVYFCCPTWSSMYSIGNIFDVESFEDIWNSEKAQEFRQSVIEKSYKYCDLEKCSCHKDDLYKDFVPNKIATKYPLVVKFCHEEQCNASCIMCRDYQIFSSKLRTDKLDSLIEPVFIPMCKDAKRVDINGSGEFFACNHSKKLVKALIEKYPDLLFGIHSNGIFFDQKNCEELSLINKIAYAEISLHASTKETYDKIVHNGNFDRVINNIKWLANLKRTGKIEKLILDFVVLNLNYKEMIDFQKFANELDVETSFWAYSDWGRAKNIRYNEVAVFEPFHPEHEKFLEVLRNPIFNSKNCNMQGSFRELI